MGNLNSAVIIQLLRLPQYSLCTRSLSTLNILTHLIFSITTNEVGTILIIPILKMRTQSSFARSRARIESGQLGSIISTLNAHYPPLSYQPFDDQGTLGELPTSMGCGFLICEMKDCLGPSPSLRFQKVAFPGGDIVFA